MSESTPTLSRSKFLVVLVCFFISGGAGLIYQVAWTKALGLVFGHTVYAIATVLAAFMGGIAAGSAYLGRWGQRNSRPVALYGWIELLIALTGAISLVGLAGVRYLYLWTYHLASGSMPVLVGLRFAASMLVLFLPTFLMGGTLPILAGGLSRSSTELGSRLGRLYWVNTAGAVSGALAAGFLLLPEIGLRRTIFFAVILNVLAALLALGAARAETQVEVDREDAEPTTGTAKVPRFLLIAFALVGATAMVYEIAWTRLLSTTLGSSTYAFTVMLATFLAGIAIGSRVFESWVARAGKVSLTTFSATQVLTGVAAVLFLIVFGRLPAILWGLITATHSTFGGLVVSQFAICALAMLPAAIIFGFNFPVVTMLIADQNNGKSPSAAAVGQACAANTIGAIVGSITAGFWLVPAIGSFRLVTYTGVVNLLLAVFLLARDVPRRKYALAGTSILAGVAALTGHSGKLYDPATANFGVISKHGYYPETLRLNEIVGMTDIVFAEDGLNASIAVTQSEDNLALVTNGKVDASTGDSLTQLMLGHVGMAFHQAPRKVLIIGFGSGMTASAVARYPEVQQIDCVEIEPAVLHAAKYLRPLNRDVLGDPRVRIIVDDARNFLFTTRDRYDVIISEPSNPWIAGVASLFTDEFYRQVRERLAPGGMLVQWVQTYTIFPEDLRMVLGTVARQFPQVTVWRGSTSDIVLLAQSQAGPLSFDHIHRLWSDPVLRKDYEQMRLGSPEALLGYNLLDDQDLRRFVAGTARNTDDLTRLEYRAPRAIFARTASTENVQMLSQQRWHPLPASISVADQRSALLAAAQVMAALGDRGREAGLLNALASYPPSVDSEILRAEWLMKSGNLGDARSALESARQLDPSSTDALLGLAEIARVQNDFATAEPLLREVLAHKPQDVPALASFALLEQTRGHWADAINWQEKRIAAETDPPVEAKLLLGDFMLRAGDTLGAEHEYKDILVQDPYNGNAHRMLGEIYRREQRWDEARVQLEAVVHYFPAGDPETYIALGDVYRNLGRTNEAVRMVQECERIFPDNPILARAAASN